MRLLLSRVALLAGACSLLSGVGVAAEKTAANDVPKIEFEEYALPNGLQVILHVDRKLPMVHVNLWFHVGSRNERVGRSGFAHLYEHMMFEGAKNAKDKYFSYAEKAGANVFEGGVNGTTSWDRTNYFATVPSGNLEYVLWLESDRLATLGEALDQARLDNQRDVVKNERRQGLENVPYGRWIKLLGENLYPFHHPYANDVIGSHEDLTAATLADVKDFFDTYYKPNNLSMVIAGDFDPAEAKRLVEKYFAPIPAGPALDRPPRSAARLDGEVVVEVKDRVPQERTYFAWHSPAFFDPGDADLDLLATILTDGLSARLNKALVYDRQLCSDTVSFQFSREAASVFIVWATARPGVALGEIEKVVDQEIARLAKEGPTPAELDRAKTKWESGFVSGLERIGGFGGKADRLNQYATFLGDPDKFEADMARYRTATVESVRQATAKWLDTRDRLLLRFHPETSVRESTVTVDRSVPPPLGADRPFLAPVVKTAKLTNGLEVLVVERPELPKVAVSIVTRIGGIDDPAEKAGVVALMANTIRLGTKTRKALEIEQALGDLGTSVSGFADRERSGLGFDVLKRNLHAALAIVSDVVQNPVFPESEVAREKKLRLDGLMQESKNPNSLAFRIGQILAFGPDHPYGRVELPASVERITRDDLARFHATYWKPGVSALVFVGDITLAEATELARRHLGSWSGAAPAPTAVPESRPVGPGKVYLVDRQDAAQTVMMGILPGPSRTAPDYQALRLADAVFGNGVTTRLNLNLREEKGYSYGVFSFPTFYSRAGTWRVFGGVQTAKTKESVAELVKETRFIAGEKPVSEPELAFAKSLRIRGYAQQFESLGRVGGQVAELWSLGLPMTELQKEPAEIEKTTLAAVNAAAQKFAPVPGLTLLLVGDVAKIEPGVRELKLGEIVVLDEEGRPIAGK
jgi:zinc protease